MPSKPLSDYSTSFYCPKHHPFWLQIQLESSHLADSLFSRSPSPFLPMKNVITSTCEEGDSGKCGGPSGQTHRGLP